MKAKDEKPRNKKSKDDPVKKQTSRKGWEPSAPGAQEAVRAEKRSLDIGGSGQFAPGGYFNQREVTRPERIDLDDYIVPPARGSKRE